MNLHAALRSPRNWALYGAGALFCAWTGAHLYALTATQNGFLRFFLTAALSLLILFRPKPGNELSRAPAWSMVFCAGGGAALAIAGLVFGIRQVEWIGILLLLYACLRWARPAAHAPDVFRALFLLYWAHPLPSRLFEPLQLAMQKMSVRGSEWLLQLFNVRVWADGFVLRTGFHTFEIPEWCSGMRTATTVFLLAWGLGVLRRLRWYETAMLVAAGLVQALVLNVLRISAMVPLVPKTADPSGVAFLHDSGGIVLVAAVFLIAAEAGLMRQWHDRRAARRDDYDPGLLAVLSEFPLFWTRLIRHRGALAATVLLATLAGLVAYKSRPSHRIDMIRDVAVALRDAKSFAEAERAAGIVLAADPANPEWRLTMLRMLLLRGKNEEAIRALDMFPANDDIQRTQLNILRAYALMGMKRLDETASIVDQLPEEIKRKEPRVAIILAEMAARAGKPEQVAEFVQLASRWGPNERRIRELYPYLRLNRQWSAIASSDSGEPYADPVQAFCVIEACMNLNRAERLAEITLQSQQRWPEDPRILEPMFLLALREGPGTWEERFGAHLRRCARANPDLEILLRVFDKCFQLARPDLAWDLFEKLNAADPSNPALLLQVVRYADAWFTFRKRWLGMSAPLPTETVDLRPQYLAGAFLHEWSSVQARIPLGGELAVPDTAAVRKRYLDAALAEFGRRDAAGQLPVSRQYDYVTALEIAGRTEEARALLQRIAEAHPERTENNRLFLSEILERKRDWPAVYETLREYPDTPAPQLNGLLRLCRAQMELRLGLAALHTGLEAIRRHPGSGQALVTCSDALIRFDSHEEALLTMSRAPAWSLREQTILEAECLWATQRFKEAEEVRRAAVLPEFPNVPAPLQRLVPMPAELTLLWHRVMLPSNREFDRNAARLRQNLQQARSPFLRALMQLWVECYDARSAEPAADMRRWEGAGRDRIEKATALNQLTLLLCRDDKLPEARAAAEAAVGFLPDVPLLWRILLSLSGADMDVVRRARAACPQDSELWLAELVASTQTNAVKGAEGGGSNGDTVPRSEQAVLRFLSQAASAPGPGISPVAMTQAGEYLYRIGMHKAADAAAQQTLPRARSYLPTYVLGVRCALQKQDKVAALKDVQLAIEASLDPPKLFYEKFVRLKSSAQPVSTDSAMINALRNLRRTDPDNPLWAEMLGYVSYRLGGADMVHALYQMTAAIDGGATGPTPYVIAAEAARYIGNFARGEDLLRQGLARNPDNMTLLNNLAYMLGADKDTVGQALQLLPSLMQREPDNPAVLDTAAVTYITAANYDLAKEMLDRMEAVVDRSDPFWFRARSRRAEVLVAQKSKAEALLLLEDLLKHTHGMPDEDVLAASTLLDELQSAQDEKKKRAPARAVLMPGLTNRLDRAEPADFMPRFRLE